MGRIMDGGRPLWLRAREKISPSRIMIKTALQFSTKIPCRRQFSNRNVKAYKFLPVPNKVAKKEIKPSLVTKIDGPTAEHLERLSLVGFENEKVVQIVEEAIAFADRILEVDTDNIKPLVTVLEDEGLFLREDVPDIDISRTELLSQAKVTMENYYVSPIGNEEFVPDKKLFQLLEQKEACKN